MARTLPLALLAFLTISLHPGCARNPDLFAWTERSKTAERTLENKEYDRAIHLFEALEQSAHSPYDANLARMRQAETLRRIGRHKDAELLLAGLLRGQRKMDPEQRAKIGYKRGRIVVDSGESERGEKLLKQVTYLHPSTIFGHRSFTYLRGRINARNTDEFLAYCQSAYQKRPRGELADNYLYESARIHFRKKNKKDDDLAATLYQKVIDGWRFENSALWDDSIWDLSLIRHRQGRYLDEIHLLKTLLSTREFTTWIGSYEIKNYKYAALRVGKVYYLNLKDYGAAVTIFRNFDSDFSESRYKDDALWWLAHSLLKDGQAGAAQEAFDRLLAKYPESKYARRVRNGAPSP